MLAHRAEVLYLHQSEVNGYPMHTWAPVRLDGTKQVFPGETAYSESLSPLIVPCFLDLMFLRTGKDPVWAPEAGRGSDRAGVGFFLPDAPITAASRIRTTRGPTGTYAVEMNVDEAWKPKAMHHLEVYLTEVAKAITGSAPPNEATSALTIEHALSAEASNA